jgi:HEAT repeat protein
MMHAAYCLGKRYRILMLPYSRPAEWHPYGRTHHQDVVQSFHAPVDVRRSVGPPLPARPRKYVLLFLLRSLGTSPDPRALPLLRWALQSEDWHVRWSAAGSLVQYADRTVDVDLLALLDDPYNGVRAAAAGALLERISDSRRHLDVTREELLAYQWMGEGTRDWARVMRLGDAARQALQIALQDDDLVVRREAAAVLRVLDSQPAPAITRASLTARIRRSKTMAHLLGRTWGRWFSHA